MELVRPARVHHSQQFYGSRPMPVAVSATLAANEALDHRRRAGLPVLPLAFGEAGLPVMPELERELSAAAGHGSYGPGAGCPGLRGAAPGYLRRPGPPPPPGPGGARPRRK